MPVMSLDVFTDTLALSPYYASQFLTALPNMEHLQLVAYYFTIALAFQLAWVSYV